MCAECNKPCESKFCSKSCRGRAWKKSKRCLKNKCKICGNPCVSLYCSYTCYGKSRETIYTEFCKICGKKFTYHEISYKKNRDRYKCCSLACASSVYNFNDQFLFSNKDIPIIYEVLGFIFAYGTIFSYDTNEIIINCPSKKLIDKFISITETTYPLQTVTVGNPRKKIYRMVIRSIDVLKYLYDIGFSHDFMKHDFPHILDEYKKHFIKGYLNSPKTSIYPKEGYNLIIIMSSSYHIIRTIAEVTNGNIITKQLSFCCAFKDYDNFYTKW